MPGISGKNSRITFNGVNLLGTRWSLNLKVDEVDITNFESPTAVLIAGGPTYSINQYVMGFFDYEFTADAVWNSGTAVLNSPPGIFPGFSPTTVTLEPDRATAAMAGKTIVFTKPMVTACTAQTEVRGAVTYNFSMKNGNETTSTITISAGL